ncbi:MAG: hypothetical protein C0483_12580 [Pirellula sp.]|nr:hypothetical protein [Pirellula sp.]
MTFRSNAGKARGSTRSTAGDIRFQGQARDYARARLLGPDSAEERRGGGGHKFAAGCAGIPLHVVRTPAGGTPSTPA